MKKSVHFQTRKWGDPEKYIWDGGFQVLYVFQRLGIGYVCIIVLNAFLYWQLPDCVFIIFRVSVLLLLLQENLSQTRRS